MNKGISYSLGETVTVNSSLVTLALAAPQAEQNLSSSFSFAPHFQQ